jgi:hypothetical protein
MPNVLQVVADAIYEAFESHPLKHSADHPAFKGDLLKVADRLAREGKVAEEFAAVETKCPPSAPDHSRLAAASKLNERYHECATAIWRLFEKDPLPADEPAHTMLERLEALIKRGLIGPTPNPAPSCSHGLILADGTCARCHAAIDPVAVAVARTKGAFQSAGPKPEPPRCSEGHPVSWLKRCDVLELVNGRLPEIVESFADDSRPVLRATKLLDDLRELPTFPTRIVYVRTCTTCGKPFESPDADPRCSACVEAGDAQGHAVDPIASDLPRELLKKLGEAIDGIEQTAIDANRRAERNAKERDKADDTGYARGRYHMRDSIAAELRQRAGRADRDSDVEREFWLQAAHAAELIQ